MRRYEVDIRAAKPEALEALEEAARVWDAQWHRLGSGGALELPVSAGLRLGDLAGSISLERCTLGTRLIYHVERSRYRLRIAHFVVLLLGGLGGLVTLLVPFYPRLVGVLPLGGLLLLLAWFLVASRLHSSGAEEFLELVKNLAEGEEEGDVSTAAGPPGEAGAELATE